MEPNDFVNFQCLLCKEFLNGKLDNNFTEHMEYHNIKFNQEFIFSTFFLSHKGIEKTVEFMLNYSEGEAQTENSSGTTKTAATESVADITTEEEIIVPDTPKARDSTKEVTTDMIDSDLSGDNSTPEDSQGTPDGEMKEEDLVSDQTQDEDLIEIEDEDLIETWNLWNEDEIRRAARTRPEENISNDVTEDDDDDDPDFQWESATSRRTIRLVSVQIQILITFSIFILTLVGRAKLKRVQMRNESAIVTWNSRMRQRRPDTWSGSTISSNVRNVL